MGRAITVGWEVGLGIQTFEGTGIGGATLDTTFFRSGSQCLKVDSGGGNTITYANMGFKSTGLPAIGDVVYFRGYYYFDNLPTAATTKILAVRNLSNAAMVSARITSAGKLALFNDNSGVQIGSDSVDTLTTGIWYRIELSYTSSNTAGTQAAELQLDGVSIASGINLTVLTTVLSQWHVGFFTAPGANTIAHVDDFAVNVGTGANQNSWPGEGKIVFLKPISDNAVGTGWVDGDGVGTLFGSVDNSPPAGAAVPANGTQIKNLTSTTTGDYDANMTTYANAGVVDGDIITLVQAVCDHGEDVATASKTGALLIVSNPTQGSEDTFTYGDDAGADGAWPTNWATLWGTAQYGDIAVANRRTSPVVRVGKRTATTREVHVDMMGIYVEFVQGIFPPWHAQARVNTNTLIRM